MNISGDTRTISELITLMLQYFGAFKSNDNKLPTDTTVGDVTVTGGSLNALITFLRDTITTGVTEDTVTYANNRPLPVKNIDRSSTDFLSSFQIADVADSSNPKYYGFERLDGKWYILKVDITANTYRYNSGASGYSTAWTNRAGVGVTYGYLSALTW